MARFTWLDYLVFGTYLLLSVGIGLWSARKKSTDLKDYFLAGHGIGSFFVGMSLLAALFSGISYLAAPADVYRNGFAFAYTILLFFIATPITAIWFLPWFYQSRFFTAYEFLEERFSLSIRLLASGLFILRVALWLAAATYAPALALEKVTGIPLWITILATGSLTTLYTALGGMRAVIWTDVLQLIVLFGGQLLIAYVALHKIPGGLGGVWETAIADGRLSVPLSFSLSDRVNLGSILLAAIFLHMVQLATDQVSVQRYLTAANLKEAQRSLWVKLWLVLPVATLFYGTGLILYAFYQIHGDPMAAGLIEKEDQILPFFVVTQLPIGLPGILIAAIYAASMSTISAGLNSLSTATMVDFRQRLAQSPLPPAKKQLSNARLTTVGYGVLVMILAFVVSQMKGNLVESVNTIIGLVGGPLLGLFILGMFTKQVSTRAALCGGIIGFLALLTLSLYQSGVFTAEMPPTRISFLWYSCLGCLVTLAVGLSYPKGKTSVTKI